MRYSLLWVHRYAFMKEYMMQKCIIITAYFKFTK